MALSGTWKATATQSGALKQGTGWNPVHANHVGGGRHSEAPNLIFSDVMTEPDEGMGGIVDPTLAPDWTDDEPSNPLWASGSETGTDQRAGFKNDDDAQVRNATAKDFPSWGRWGVPGGARIRAVKRGSGASNTGKQSPYETWGEGWDNKLTGDVENAVTSDPAQYVMQTSMMQRDRTRDGSQVSGRANDDRHPIASRIVGMKIKPWSGQLRHYDMTPRTQDQIIRPWWGRTAFTTGTDGDPELWNRSNSAYESVPLQRQIPADPYQGPQAPTGPNTHGFVPEDVTY